jgi:hypothetical protein
MMAEPTACHGAVPIFIGSKLTTAVGYVAATSAFGPDPGSGLFLD